MTIYVDNDNKCHVEPAEGRRAIDEPFFDGKCKRFIEGYLYIPNGDGAMITPHEPYVILAAVQKQYEESQQIIAEYEAALTEIEIALGVGVE